MPQMTLRRWSRWLLRGLAFIVGVVVVAVALLQTSPVATWAVRRLLRVVPLNPGYALEVDRVSGNWFSALQFEGVRLLHGDRELARVDRVRAGYDLRRLLGVETRISDLAIEGGRVAARRGLDGWDLAGAFRRASDTATSRSRPLAIGRLALRDVQLTAEFAPNSAVLVRDLAVRVRNLTMGDVAVGMLDTIAGRVAPPAPRGETGAELRWLAFAARGAATAAELRLDPLFVAGDRSRIAGAVVLPRHWDDTRSIDRFAVRLDATPIALADVASWVPGVRSEGDLQLALRVVTENRLASGRLTGRLGEATLALDGSTMLGRDAPAVIRMRGAVRALDASRLYATAPAGRYDADFSADLRGRDIRQASGRLELGVESAGAAEAVLRRVGFRADLARGRADLAMRAALRQGSVTASGWARPFDSIPSYSLKGEARRLPGGDSLARRLAGPAGDPTLSVHFNVAGSGAALAAARITGRADLVAVRRGGELVRLGNVLLTVADKRVALRPELSIGGGRIAALASVRLDKPITYDVGRGEIDHVDLSRLTGDTAAIVLSGRFSGHGTGTTPAEAAAAFCFELDTLRYGARRIDALVATVRLDRGRALVDVGGALQGGRLALALDARPFDSTRTFVLRRGSLAHVDLGALLGRPSLAGPVTLDFSGRGRQRGAARDFEGRLDIRPSRLGRIALHSGAAAVALHGDRATYDASLVTSGGALAAAGEVTALGTSPALSVRQGRFDSLDLAALLGRPKLESRLDGRFAVSLRGQRLGSMQGEGSLELLPSRIGGDTLRSGRLAFTVDRGAVDGDLRVESSAGGLAARTALHAVSDSAGLVSLGGTVAARGEFRGVRLDTLIVALRPVAGAIDIDTLALRSNVAELDGWGRLALRPPPASPGMAGRASTTPDTLRLAGRARDLAPLMALAGLDSAAADSALFDITVTGAPRHRQVTSDASAVRLLYAGKQASRLALRATASLDSAGVAGIAGDLRVEGAAAGRVRIANLVVTARYDSVVALRATVQLGDSVHLVTALRGTATRDSAQAVLQQFDLTESGRTWALEQPAALLLRPRIVVDHLALRSADRRILVDGTIDRRGSNDLSLAVDGLDLDVFRDLGLVPIPGRLDGRLRLAGPAAKPTIEGRFGLTVRRGAEELGQLTANLSWTDAGLRLDAAAVSRRGGRLTATGTLPWQLSLAPSDSGPLRRTGGTVDFRVHADSFGLALFDPLLPAENAKNLHGRLAVDTRVTGPLEQPLVEGQVRLTEVGVELPALGLNYRDGELIADFTGDALQVASLKLRTGRKEELAAQGTVRFRPLTDPALDLTATLRDFRISNSPTLHTIGSGRLALQGTVAAPSLTGGLRLGRTEVFQGAEGKPAAVRPVELAPKDLRELAQHFGPAALAQANKGPGLVERFRLDLDIRLPGNVWFRRRVNPRADIELSGRLKLKQEPGQEMQFFGTVEPTPQRGFLDVYGRSFRLTGGQIYLTGPVDSMKLDVTAEYQVPTQAGPDAGIVIDVAAKGRADSLSLDFTSDPSLGQEDIISYIVTGRPASENPLAQQGGSPGEAGAEFAFGALSERLAGAAGAKLGLDVFQIKQDGLRGLTLTAGRYVAPRLFLSLQQPIQLSSDAQQAPGANLGPGFELEYTVRRWLRANLRGGSLPPRFFFRSRYAY